jgi:hypothetical protein
VFSVPPIPIRLLTRLGFVLLLLGGSTPSVALARQAPDPEGELQNRVSQSSVAPAAVSNVADRGMVFDAPGDEEDLNREIWEASGRKDYAALLAYVKRRQAGMHLPTTLPLPNGWALAPAGRQVAVGRLPFEAVIYRDRVVVLNAGHTGKDPQTVSVLDPASAMVERTLAIPALYPSAAVGLDGDLYISGGFERKLHRFNAAFAPVRTYSLAGYGGPVAALDRDHLVVGTLVAPKRPAAATKAAAPAEEERREQAKPSGAAGVGSAGTGLQAALAAAAEREGGRRSGGGEKDGPAQLDGAGRLALLNSATGQIERESRGVLFPTAIQVLNGKIYVASLGEQRLLVFNPQLQLLARLPLGRIPSGLCSDGRLLYALSSGRDSISVIDSESDRVLPPIDLRFRGFRYGSSPTSCSVDGNRLYVSQADINAIAVIDRASGTHLGFIPTGWYPTRVLNHGPWLLSLSAKGIEPRRPNPRGPRGDQYVLALLRGNAGILPKATIDAQLAGWTQSVLQGNPLVDPQGVFRLPIRHVVYVVKENRTYDQVLGDLKPGNGDPSLAVFGEAVTPHHHALARQFVTLDNVFTNGEVSVLGHSFTTSGYASPFVELLANLSYAGRYPGYPFGLVPATFSPGYLWNALEAKGIDYRIYGETYYLFTEVHRLLVERYGAGSPLVRRFEARTLELSLRSDRGRAFSERMGAFEAASGNAAAIETLLTQEPMRELLSEVFSGDRSLAQSLAGDAVLRRRFAAFLAHYALAYPPYNLAISDLERVAIWKRDFERQLASGRVAPLQYIWLPNDHTAGANPGFLAPRQFVAQNDAALGELVNTLAQSPIWKNTLVLVIEDDAQNGPDHVDATRTVALAAGPMVKRGALVSDRYDQLSLLRTIEVIFGLDPLNLGDGLAAPMFGLFSTSADDRPYLPPPASGALTSADRQRLKALRPGAAVRDPLPAAPVAQLGR